MRSADWAPERVAREWAQGPWEPCPRKLEWRAPWKLQGLTVWMEGYFGRWPAWLGALGCKCKKQSCVITISSSFHHHWLFQIYFCFQGQWHLMGGLQPEWWKGGERSEEEEGLISVSGGRNVPVLSTLPCCCSDPSECCVLLGSL